MQHRQITAPPHAVNLRKALIGHPTAHVKIRKQLLLRGRLKKKSRFLQIFDRLLQLSHARKNDSLLRVKFGQKREFRLCAIHELAHQSQRKVKAPHAFQCDMIKPHACFLRIRLHFQSLESKFQTFLVQSQIVAAIDKSGIKSLRMAILFDILQHQAQISLDFCRDDGAAIAIVIEAKSLGIRNAQPASAAVYIFMDLPMIAQPWRIAEDAQASVAGNLCALIVKIQTQEQHRIQIRAAAYFLFDRISQDLRLNEPFIRIKKDDPVPPCFLNRKISRSGKIIPPSKIQHASPQSCGSFLRPVRRPRIDHDDFIHAVQQALQRADDIPLFILRDIAGRYLHNDLPIYSCFVIVITRIELNLPPPSSSAGKSKQKRTSPEGEVLESSFCNSDEITGAS